MLYYIKKQHPIWNRVFRKTKDIAEKIRFYVSPIDSIRFSGDLSVFLDEQTVRSAVIGDRSIDCKAKEQINGIIERMKKTDQLNHRNTILVSSFSAGVDITALQAALDNGIPVVAVLSEGLEGNYPKRYKDIAERIIQTPGSGLLTQFEDSVTVTRNNYYDRDAVIALVSDVVNVVTAKKDSRAHQVAMFTQAVDIPLYAVPGEADDPLREGCNNLIEEGIAHAFPRWEALTSENNNI